MNPRLLLTMLVTLAALLTGTPATAATRAAATPVRVMTYNICGNVCRQGEVATTAGNVAYQVRSRAATIAMLQEVCYSQFLGVRSRLARYGYSAVFAAAASGGHCDDDDHRHGRAFGVAIIARGTLSGQIVRRLPSPYEVNAEGRVALGVTARLAGRSVFVVTAHTAPRGQNLAAQLDMVRRWVAPIAAKRAVLVGGDLNAMPDNPGLNDFYASFREANGGREHPLPTFITTPRKIDYLFGSPRFLAPRGVTRSCNHYSDHCAYVGSFQ
jgi:endonuclease/exonuclease/phosphatase family metal-dependent hydrolase